MSQQNFIFEASETISTLDGDTVKIVGNRVYLNLETEGTNWRLIGRFDSNCIYLYRTRKKERLEKYNAYGVNCEMMDKLKHIPMVKIRDERGATLIRTEDVRKCETYRSGHSSDGQRYEWQYLVPIEWLEQ